MNGYQSKEKMADKSGSTTHEITYYLNIENAKVLGFVMVIGFIAYHGVIHLKHGNDSCKWLLSDGRFPGYGVWQPYGCMTHKYTKEDARMCMHYIAYWGGRNHITFLGDSRIRHMFISFVNLLSNEEVKVPEKAHQDIHWKDDKISARVDFLWYPYVDTPMYNVYRSWMLSGPQARPNLIVTSSATWSIKYSNASKEALKNFEANLTYIVPYFEKMKESTDILWMLEDPVAKQRLSASRSMITNEQIDSYNKAALEIFANLASTVKVWKSSRLVAQGMKKELFDGLHLTESALQLKQQMLINMYCNNQMNHDDGTCCSNAEPITTLQTIVASFFLVCIVSAVALLIYRRRMRRNGLKIRTDNGQRTTQKNGQTSPQEHTESMYEILTSLSKLGIIMAYFFLCDRTNFFMKENKYFTSINFFLPFAYIMILGFFFTESTDKTEVLHRDQTDEWKGWMQLVIMIYHLTGASKVLPIYMHIRVLVSCYLFLTGYGHFTYFWKKGEYGLYRYCQGGCRHFSLYWQLRQNGLRRFLEVLFRLNLLVVTLCFVMNRPYQFYYFVPLVSFWFIVVYFAMTIWPHVSEKSAEEHLLHYFYLVLKFAVLVTVITLFYLSAVFFEKVFLIRPFKPLFVTSDDSVHEWRFRWSLDRYSVVYGMMFAFGYQVLKRYHVIRDNTGENLFSSAISWGLTGFGVIGLGSYAAFSCLCRNKEECNDVHSYITFLPIVSFILIRNSVGWLRTRYSSFFAWFGRISLELFISQYHIWLAADTHGVLVLIPSYPVLNVILTSFIFICASHEISKITFTLTKYAVPQEWKRLLRNMLLFGLVLLPLCFTRGVFTL